MRTPSFWQRGASAWPHFCTPDIKYTLLQQLTQEQNGVMMNRESSCNGVCIITRVGNQTRNMLVLESTSETQVTYVQGRLRSIFNTISCGLQSRVANNRINTVCQDSQQECLDIFHLTASIHVFNQAHSTKYCSIN